MSTENFSDSPVATKKRRLRGEQYGRRRSDTLKPSQVPAIYAS